jgi:hypothetical protein
MNRDELRSLQAPLNCVVYQTLRSGLDLRVTLV